MRIRLRTRGAGRAGGGRGRQGAGIRLLGGRGDARAPRCSPLMSGARRGDARACVTVTAREGHRSSGGEDIRPL